MTTPKDHVEVRPFLAYICPECRGHCVLHTVHKTLNTPAEIEAEFGDLKRRVHKKGCSHEGT